MIGQNTFQIRQIIQKIWRYQTNSCVHFCFAIATKREKSTKKSDLKFPIWKPGEFKSKLSEEMDRNRQDLISV